MSPDPVVDDDEMLDLGPDVDFDEVLDKHAADDEDRAAQAGAVLPAVGRGHAVRRAVRRRRGWPGAARGRDPRTSTSATRPIATVEAAEPAPAGPNRGGSAFVRGVWVVVQCILAVAFGAGLFIAFDQLWRWNTIVALVLSVLVILGLVVGVRVVRKTEDIGSTLIAVAVGALVTLGPLALLQSH